jgi:CubicO group peptidase (beta-lactamase class C family)
MADAEQKFAALRELVPAAMKRHRVPGVAVGIFADGREFTAGFGVTNIRHPLEVNEHTLFQIGSTTKTFTATLAMRLVEAGSLDLDAPVRRYLPGFRMKDPEVTERVTMRHLLTHTGGWEGDYFDDTGAGDDAHKIYVERMAELPQLTPLGDVWSYNNAAFSLAGRVIEALTGSTYEATLTEQVLKPLGLKRSFIFPTCVMTHRFAVGHATTEQYEIVLQPWHVNRSSNPAGGIASTVTDQLRYARFHMGDGSIGEGAPVISTESVRRMQAEIRPAQLDTKIGLAWWLDDAGGVRFVAHGGETLGQISTFVMAPSRGFAITVLTNSVSGGRLARDVRKFAFEQYLGVTIPDPGPIAMPAGALAEYAGRYAATLGEAELKVEQGNLMMQVTSKGGFPKKDSPPGPPQPPTRLAFIGRDRVLALDAPFDGAQGEFLRDAHGEIEWLRWGARINRRI